MPLITLFSNLLISTRIGSPFFAAVDWPPTAELRWQLAGFAIGVVILSFGFAGLSLFLSQRKTADRSLVYFSLFSLLYAIRLLFRLGFLRSLIPASESFWNYSNLAINDFIDNFIILPLTLFFMEVAQARWKPFLRWVLAFQTVFAATRFSSKLFHKGERPVDIIYHIVVIAYCTLLAYPLFFSRERRMSRELRVIYAGLALFGLFVVRNNLGYLGILRGRDVEAFGFLILAGCLGYVAASRTHSNEQHLVSLQKELEIARQIQASILPREIPLVPGLDIAAKYVPMTAVAGDFYDFLAVDKKRLGILVADVTGHGVPAALIASMLKTALAAQSAFAADPARVLAGLNHALCGKFEEHFVTAAYLFVDAGEQILRYAGAGHPPLMLGALNDKETAFHEIDSNGLLLGLTEDAIYRAVELPFRPGDRCVLYTDGMVEAKNDAREEFGASRFLGFLKKEAHLAAAPLLSASLAELTRWSKRDESAVREDDITLIAVDFKPLPPSH